jgi:hypothetical protein
MIEISWNECDSMTLELFDTSAFDKIRKVLDPNWNVIDLIQRLSSVWTHLVIFAPSRQSEG